MVKPRKSMSEHGIRSRSGSSSRGSSSRSSCRAVVAAAAVLVFLSSDFNSAFECAEYQLQGLLSRRSFSIAGL